MGSVGMARFGKQVGRMIRSWILFAGCTALAAHVVDAEYEAGQGLGADRREPLVLSAFAPLRHRAAGRSNSPVTSQ